jgi:hypothetical protein
MQRCDMPNSIPNFRVAIQAADEGGAGAEGEARYTPWAKDLSDWSAWASDADHFDPDAVRVLLDVEANNPLPDKDFRLEIQASDGGGTAGLGPKQFTPWASQGGGWSGIALDSDAFDPDAFRIKIQTRPWTSSRTFKDFRLGVQVVDNGGKELGEIVGYTPWASESGGTSEYAVDLDQFDPDGFKVQLEVRFE